MHRSPLPTVQTKSVWLCVCGVYECIYIVYMYFINVSPACVSAWRSLLADKFDRFSCRPAWGLWPIYNTHTILLYWCMCMWNMLRDRKREGGREGKSMLYGTTDCLIIPIAASDLTRVPSLDRWTWVAYQRKVFFRGVVGIPQHWLIHLCIQHSLTWIRSKYMVYLPTTYIHRYLSYRRTRDPSPEWDYNDSFPLSLSLYLSI